jgi:Lsr2
MAQKVQVVLIDDIDGGEATETVTFGLDGATYEIDLSDRNASQLRDALAHWVGNARRVSGRPTRPSGRRGGGSSSSSSSDTTAIRAWAKENGYKVSERGRISAEVQQAYAAAH